MVNGTFGRMRRKSGLETAAHRDGTSQSLLQLGSLLMEFPFVRNNTRNEEQQGPRRPRNGCNSPHGVKVADVSFFIYKVKPTMRLYKNAVRVCPKSSPSTLAFFTPHRNSWRTAFQPTRER